MATIPPQLPVLLGLIDYYHTSEGNLMMTKRKLGVRVKRLVKLVRPFHGIYHRSDERLDDGRIRDRLLGIE